MGSGVNISGGSPEALWLSVPQLQLPSDGPGAHNIQPRFQGLHVHCVLHIFLLGYLVRERSTESCLNPNSCFPAPAAFPCITLHPPHPSWQSCYLIVRPDSWKSSSFSHISYPVHQPISPFCLQINPLLTPFYAHFEHGTTGQSSGAQMGLVTLPLLDLPGSLLWPSCNLLSLFSKY